MYMYAQKEDAVINMLGNKKEGARMKQISLKI
jgi:hypothetical protein